MSEINSVRFISDLHLSEQTPHLTELFYEYLASIAGKTSELYILGDLFEMWLGDDLASNFEKQVASRIKALAESGCSIYFIAGNRDFLLGDAFCQEASMRLLNAPHLMTLEGKKILLTHGDELCILDKSHQRFRAFSRSKWVKKLFLSLSQGLRVTIANRIREASKQQTKGKLITDVVESECLKTLQAHDCTVLIHGHTHRPELTSIGCKESEKCRYVLSDWRTVATELCYNQTHGFKLIT